MVPIIILGIVIAVIYLYVKLFCFISKRCNLQCSFWNFLVITVFNGLTRGIFGMVLLVCAIFGRDLSGLPLLSGISSNSDSGVRVTAAQNAR